MQVWGLRAYEGWVVHDKRRRPEGHRILMLRDHHTFVGASAVRCRCCAAVVTRHHSGIVRARQILHRRPEVTGLHAWSCTNSRSGAVFPEVDSALKRRGPR